MSAVVYGQPVEVEARDVASFVSERLCPLPLGCLTRIHAPKFATDSGRLAERLRPLEDDLAKAAASMWDAISKMKELEFPDENMRSIFRARGIVDDLRGLCLGVRQHIYSRERRRERTFQ